MVCIGVRKVSEGCRSTNPSLILKAVQKPEYAPLMRATVAQYKGRSLDEVMDAYSGFCTALRMSEGLVVASRG